MWRKRVYNLRAHSRDINSWFLLYNNELYASSSKWIDVYNNVFALNSQFNPRHIYYVSHMLWLFLSRSSSHVITSKFQYDRNTDLRKKQIFIFTAQNELSITKHPVDQFFVGFQKHEKAITNILRLRNM